MKRLLSLSPSLPSSAGDPQAERPLRRDLGPRPLLGPLRLGAVQPARHHHLRGPVRAAGGQHLRSARPGLAAAPLADQPHAEGHAGEPIGEHLAERQQQRGNGAEQPHAGRSVTGKEEARRFPFMLS